MIEILIKKGGGTMVGSRGGGNQPWISISKASSCSPMHHDDDGDDDANNDNDDHDDDGDDGDDDEGGDDGLAYESIELPTNAP